MGIDVLLKSHATVLQFWNEQSWHSWTNYREKNLQLAKHSYFMWFVTVISLASASFQTHFLHSSPLPSQFLVSHTQHLINPIGCDSLQNFGGGKPRWHYFRCSFVYSFVYADNVYIIYRIIRFAHSQKDWMSKRAKKRIQFGSIFIFYSK